MSTRYVILTREPYGGARASLRTFRSSEDARDWASRCYPETVVWASFPVIIYPSCATFVCLNDTRYGGVMWKLPSFHSVSLALSHGANFLGEFSNPRAFRVEASWR